MKALLIATLKTILYIAILLLTCWVLQGFKEPTRVDIATLLAVGAIMRHFADRESDKQE